MRKAKKDGVKPVFLLVSRQKQKTIEKKEKLKLYAFLTEKLRTTEVWYLFDSNMGK